ncbi:MAG: acetyltransferase [Hyphomicrobiales bacterium]|nr:acetyltransferase [Hyphomicrobiales bacterium]
MISPVALRRWAKGRETPLARFAYDSAKALRGMAFPVIPGVHAALYALHKGVHGLASTILRVVWSTPLFQSRLETPARGLYLYGGVPLVLGPVRIALGEGCRVSGQTTISGRSASRIAPTLSVGRNCDIGWQTTIAVGGAVVLGDNVRIAGRAFLAGYPGHPLDPAARASGAPDTDDQVGDIVLEDDVWLATGVTVCAGVRIGAGSVIAAGSVVTKDVPAGVLAAGVPARVVRKIV